jgi:uncharacterized protein with FMN-binding domain
VRRAPIVLTATVIGTVAVLSFKPSAVEAVSTAGNSAAALAKASATTSAGVTTATGAPITTQFGTTQVQVTIKNGKITDVKTLQSPANEPQSQQISSQAIPLLQASALSKQSAAIDTVSGATYTSGSYAASLQSALDKAGFKAANGQVAPTTAPTADSNGGGRGGGHGGPGGGCLFC